MLELNKEDNGTRTFTLVTNNENNIGQNVTYERLFRINHGFGTKKEQNFDWIKKNQPYRSNLDVFWIKYFNTKVFKKQNDINLLIEKLEKMLVDFGLFLNDDSNKMSKKLNYLLALKPQKKDENALD
nr:hypothetical protein [Mesomycoplasma flocculare]